MSKRDTRTPEQEGMLCVANELCRKGILLEGGRAELELLIEEGRMAQAGLFLSSSIRGGAEQQLLTEVDIARLEKTVRASEHLASFR